MVRAAALIALLLASPAVAADQFDLICKGKTETAHYRVDLAAGEWCWEKCTATIKIASVTSSRITFMDRDNASAFVDRASGEWWQNYRSSYFSAYNHGFCTPAPFSGFPVAKF